MVRTRRSAPSGPTSDGPRQADPAARWQAGSGDSRGGRRVLTGLGGLLTLGLTAGGAEVDEAVSAHDGVAGADHPVLQQLMARRSPFVDRLPPVLTHLGRAAGMAVIAAVITVVMNRRRRSWTPLILMAVTVAVAVLWAEAMGFSRVLLGHH